MNKTKDYAMELSEKSMYKIQEEHLELLYAIESLDGEITEETEELLIINKNELEVKSESYLHVITKKESYNTLIDNEIKRLRGLKQRNVNLVSRLKDSLLQAVKLNGDFSFGLTKIGTRKSQSVEVEDVNQLPKEYKTIKVTESANKAAIKSALKSGIEIVGCSIKDNQNLKIN